MDDGMFAELEASLKEGMAILRKEEKPSRTFSFATPDVKTIRDTFRPDSDADTLFKKSS